jgi:hypothetical protein
VVAVVLVVMVVVAVLVVVQEVGEVTLLAVQPQLEQELWAKVIQEVLDLMVQVQVVVVEQAELAKTMVLVVILLVMVALDYKTQSLALQHTMQAVVAEHDVLD